MALALVGMVAGGGAGLAWWLNRELAPMPAGNETVIRIDPTAPRTVVYKDLARRSVIRNVAAFELMARLQRQPETVREGSYRVRSGMTADEIFQTLQKPIRQNVRIPEGWWIRRVAKRLESQGVCSAADYIAAAGDAARFADVTKLPIPRTGSLEGFLFPDTYDLPPKMGAEAVIRRQLRAFRQRVGPILQPETDLRRILTIASMVELEAARNAERPRIAGVIENRMRERMTLDIDATVLYALQEWKVLGPGVVRTVDSPYNTYLRRGLPPGPIGSPGLASIQAAIAPESHPYFFYVARPDRSHFFTANYPAHRAAIRRARAEFRAEAAKSEAAKSAEQGTP